MRARWRIAAPLEGISGALPRHRYEKPLAGFTATDLLVTVAVVSFFAAFLLTVAVAARQKARLARCTSNLRQVGAAVLSFAKEHNQTLPTISPGDNRPLWWFYKEQVKAYAGLPGPSSTNDVVFSCPSDRGYSDPIPFHRNARFDFGSYVFNGVTMPGVPHIAGWPVSAIKKPQRTLLVMEWTAHAPLSWHKSKTGKNNQPFYCDARSVTAFVDGHVSFTKIYYDGYNAAFTQDPLPGYDYQYSGN